MNVDQFLAATGWTIEPRQRVGVEGALRWFETNLNHGWLADRPEHPSPFGVDRGRMETNLVQMMQGIDFSMPVVAGADVAQGTRLIRYGWAGRPWGQFLTTPDTSPDRLGIPRGQRTRYEFRVDRKFRCLKTFAQDVNLYWDKTDSFGYARGGGVQLFLADLSVLSLAADPRR